MRKKQKNPDAKTPDRKQKTQKQQQNKPKNINGTQQQQYMTQQLHGWRKYNLTRAVAVQRQEQHESQEIRQRRGSSGALAYMKFRSWKDGDTTSAPQGGVWQPRRGSEPP